MVNNTDNQTNQTSNREGILKVLARLATTGIISFGIGGAVTFDRYNNYWNQTIFRVQTVDFNILSHTLPTKLSYAITQNQPEEVQRTLDSNYNLFGLIVTDASGQKIITFSGKNSGDSSSWKAALNPQELKNYPYDVLLDPPPVFSQWNYSNSHATERSATNFTNRGRVIGRVYYVRGVRPTFPEDVMTLLSNPFSNSSRIQTYTTSLIACFGGTLLVWSGLEFILYKKRIDQQNAQRELELAEERARRERELVEERRQRELAVADARRNSELAIAEERRQRDLEEAEKERQRQLAEVEARGQELMDNHQILQVQLAERINELQLLQQQREDERDELMKDADDLRILNTRLKKKILKLRESIKNLSANTDSTDLQIELDKIKLQSEQNLAKKQQYEQYIQKLTQQLQITQIKQLESNETQEQRKSELQKIQQQIDDIENSRSETESQLKELRTNEENHQRTIAILEEQLNNKNSKEEELQKQLESLQNSLSEYQDREQLLEQRAEQAKAESEALVKQIATYEEEIGRHPLNDFEIAIQKSLQQNFSNSRIEIQFDVGTGRQGTRFTDFILVTKRCCIILEAKSYKGIIKSIGDVRNSGWICQQTGGILHIYSSWGKNPYHQLKTYCDSLMKNRNLSVQLGIQDRSPIYGLVVFPVGSDIDDSIQSNMADRFYRVTTLDNLTTAIQELDNQANSWN